MPRPPIRRTNLFYLLILLGSLSSCDTNRIFEENINVSDEGWQATAPYSFSFDVSDTLTPCNFYFNVRHTGEYAYSNLYVFIKTIFPNNEAARDTFECVLQQPDGKWLGSGTAGGRDHQVPFKMGLRFPLKGTYIFEVEQAMREPKLMELKSIGIRVEKAK